MDQPPLIDQLRDYRARIHSGNLTLESAAQELAADPRHALTEEQARDLLTRPVADVEAEYVRTFEARRQEILSRVAPGAHAPDPRQPATADPYLRSLRDLNEAYTDEAAARLAQFDGDAVKAGTVLGIDLMEQHHIRPGQEQQRLAHLLSVLYVERALARAEGEEGR